MQPVNPDQQIISESAPIDNVGLVSEKKTELVTIFLPIYLSQRDEEDQLGALQFLRLAEHQEFEVIKNRILQKIVKESTTDEFLVGQSAEECYEIIDAHSWYKANSAFLICEVNINRTALGDKKSESDFWGPGALNADTTLHPRLTSKVDPKSLNIIGLINYSLDFVRSPTSITHYDCYAIAKLQDLKESDFQNGKAYFYPGGDKKVKAIYFFNGMKFFIDCENNDEQNSIFPGAKFPETGMCQWSDLNSTSGISSAINAPLRIKLQESIERFRLYSNSCF